MNKQQFVKFILAFLFLISLTTSSWAQREATINTAPAIMNTASEANPIEFNYKDTPDLVYGAFKKNPFAKFTADQLAILAEYEYPRFSSQGLAFLELDIMKFKEARKNWDTANVHRIEEIHTRLGITK